METIPYGFCKCGCGGKTKTAERSRPYLGHIKGQPLPYLHAHAGMRARQRHAANRHPERFWAKVEKTERCWEWTGQLRRGYGYYVLGGKKHQAHRVAYEMAHGKVPASLELDHLCHNRSCVNPSHLEPVSHSENVIRGYKWRKGNR